MENYDERKMLFNMPLAKCFGLYQILDPRTVRIFGYNAYHVGTVVLAVYGSFMSMVLCVNGWHSWTHGDTTSSVLYFMMAENGFYVVYKMMTLVRYSRQVWRFLAVTRFDFTSLHHRSTGRVFGIGRARSLRLTNVLAVLLMGEFTWYVFSPLLLYGTYVPVKNSDGSTSNYRLNMFKAYLPVSADKYNEYFFAFYIAEMVFYVFFSFSWLIFESFIITCCLAVTFQLGMVCESFESLGHSDVRLADAPPDLTSTNSQFKKDANALYKDLKKVLGDGPRVLEKLDEFLIIVRRIVLSQIFISSTTIIVICYILTMDYLEGRMEDSMGTYIELIFSLPGCCYQMFIVCYLFDNINSQKESLTFAMYSSNWPEMDLKCKQLILNAMRINDSNEKKLRFSRAKIINLEMYFQTMRVCYSVLSMLVNTTQEQQ